MAENKSVVKNEEKEVVYQVSGEDVKLTQSIVSQFIARGNKDLTGREIGNFIQLCRYRKLNPFLNEAYPVKFGNEGAQLIVGFEAFKRKAEENPRYQGHKAGIIVMRGEEVLELEGAFKLPKDTLVGGWAEVAVDGKKYPVVAKVSFSEYNKGQSTWKQIPSTMIRKVALVQALREAFPSDLGAMYSSEEMGIDDNKLSNAQTVSNIQVEVKEEIQENANKEVIDIPFSEVSEMETDYVESEIVSEEEFNEAGF